MRYEVVREIFNHCQRNQMRDVFIEELEIEDPRAHVESFCKGEPAQIEETVNADGTLIYDLELFGIRQRFTFTPD